jgi:hypothetical protein
MDDMLGRLLSSDKAAIALATEEYLEIHALVDKCGIPREFHSEKLTAAQRVSLLVTRFRQLIYVPPATPNG